jgi:hypothetical protein
MEVVLPTGDVVRLGMGALPGKDGVDNPTWQSFQYGYGPYSDGIFTQSNFGIVTKMGFWLMPATEHLTFVITFPRDDDFERIVEVIRPLSVSRVLGNVPQLRHAVQELAISGKSKKEFYDGEGPMPPEVVREHMKKTAYGDVAWVFYGEPASSLPEQILTVLVIQGTVYGPEAARNASLDAIRKAFAVIPEAKFIFPNDVPADHYLHSRGRISSGVPELTDLNWLQWHPNGAHLFFAPISPTDGRDARKLFDIVKKRHVEFGFDMMPTFCVAPREMHFIDILTYDRGNEDEKRRAVACLRAMIDDAAKEGYGEYRTHILVRHLLHRSNNYLRFSLHVVTDRRSGGCDVQLEQWCPHETKRDSQGRAGSERYSRSRKSGNLAEEVQR